MRDRNYWSIAQRFKSAGDAIIWMQSISTAIIEFVGLTIVLIIYLKTHPEVIVLTEIVLRHQIFPFLAHILGILSPLQWFFPPFSK